MTDGNDLSYSTSDPSGGSTEPPARPGAKAIAMPVVAMPVIGRPTASQALRRPPAPTRSQSSNSHRRTERERERSRDRDRDDPLFGRYRPTVPTRENSPAHSNASTRRKREERECRRVRRERADQEETRRTRGVPRRRSASPDLLPPTPS